MLCGSPPSSTMDPRATLAPGYPKPPPTHLPEVPGVEGAFLLMLSSSCSGKWRWGWWKWDRKSLKKHDVKAVQWYYRTDNQVENILGYAFILNVYSVKKWSHPVAAGMGSRPPPHDPVLVRQKKIDGKMVKYSLQKLKLSMLNAQRQQSLTISTWLCCHGNASSKHLHTCCSYRMHLSISLFRAVNSRF